MKATKGFIKYFSDNPPSFISDDSMKIRVAGKLYDYTDQGAMLKLFNPTVILDYDLADWHKLENLDKLEFIKNFIEGSFRQDRTSRLEKKEKLASIMNDSILKLPDTDYILENLQPCRIIGDLRKEGGFCFIDKKTQKITEYDYHSVYLALCRDLEEKTVKRFMQGLAHITVIYDPHDKFGMNLVEDSNNIYSINTYRKPVWAKLKAEPVLDSHIEGLLNHLFPSEECREFVLTWIYHSLTARCQTYLYLCGGQGSGKNTLANLLIKLHGEENSTTPKGGAVNGRFNYFLKEKRFVFFDEFNCRSNQDKDTLKNIINNNTQVEAKGKEHEQIDIYASYIIANNSKDAIAIDPIDRRFSVPDITDTPLMDKGRDWVRELQEKIETPQVIANFNAYILENFKEPKFYCDDVWQKKNFDDIVLSTARLAYVDLLDRVLNKEEPEYDYYEEAERFKRTHRNSRFPVMTDWQNYLKGLKKDGVSLGEIKGRFFVPRQEFRSGEGRGDLV